MMRAALLGLTLCSCAPLRPDVIAEPAISASSLGPAWEPSIGWAKCIAIDDARLRAGGIAVGAGLAGTTGGGLATLLGAFDEKTGRIVGGASLIALGVTVGVAKFLEEQETTRFANYCVAPHVEKVGAAETHAVP